MIPGRTVPGNQPYEESTNVGRSGKSQLVELTMKDVYSKEPIEGFSEEKESLESLNRAQRRSYRRYRTQQSRKHDILRSRQMKKVHMRIEAQARRGTK